MEQQDQYEQCAVCGSDAFACLDRIDRKKHLSEFDSRTIKCRSCEACFLYVRHDDRSTNIHLRQFLERRGKGGQRRPLDNYTMAEGLFEAMMWDFPIPSMAMSMDFGIESPQHYQAMRWLVDQGAGPYELDRVLGDGKAITRLFRFACGESELPGLHFSTPYDALYEAAERAQAR